MWPGLARRGARACGAVRSGHTAAARSLVMAASRYQLLVAACSRRRRPRCMLSLSRTLRSVLRFMANRHRNKRERR